MLFCIFSYNRGNFLLNCIESIEKCAADSAIRVFDDQSTDEETNQILDRVAQKYKVYNARKLSADKGRHGGLYANMQIALDTIEGDELVCFLQDDTQLVRTLSEDDFEYMTHYFEQNPNAGFLHPAMLKSLRKTADLKTTVWNSKTSSYNRSYYKRSAGVYYSDIFVSTANRLKQKHWQFQESESRCENLSQSTFDLMGYMYAPFIMWLPLVPAYRGKNKTLALKIGEKLRKCGLYPFKYMTPQEVKTLKHRSFSELPFAEDLLTSSASHLKMPWVYGPLQKAKVLKKLNQVESFFRS